MSEERQWVEAVRAGDIEQFRHIVDRFAPMLFAVAYGVLTDHHRAEDAAQEALLQAFIRLPALREPDKLNSWLHGWSSLQTALPEEARMLKESVQRHNVKYPSHEWLLEARS